MKAKKILRPLMKCPKCGHRKRVDLKYLPGATFQVPVRSPLSFPHLSGHSAAVTSTVISSESVALVCPVCEYRHCVVDPLDKLENREKVRQSCEVCPEYKKCHGIHSCVRPDLLRKAFGYDEKEIAERLKEEKKDGGS